MKAALPFMDWPSLILEMFGWLIAPIGMSIWQLSSSQKAKTIGMVIAFSGLLLVILMLIHGFNDIARISN